MGAPHKTQTQKIGQHCRKLRSRHLDRQQIARHYITSAETQQGKPLRRRAIAPE